MKKNLLIKHFTFFIIILLIANLCTPCWAFSIEDEITVGKQAAQEVESKYKVLDSPEYQGRINWIGSLLYRVCPKKELPYTFKVLDSDIFNAFALPGGFIYINKGLMDKCSDGEIAFVLGHEMAHCAHSHQFKQAEKNLSTTLGILALALILGRGSLTQGAANTAALANAVMTSSYSRADERQADIDSLSYMAGAGFDPNYAVYAFEKMKQYGSRMPNLLNTIVGSHPAPEDRINYVRERINEINFHPSPNDPVPPYGSESNDSYLKRLSENKDMPTTSTQELKSDVKVTITQKTITEKKPSAPEPTYKKPAPKMTPEETFATYRIVDFSNLTKKDLEQGRFLTDAESGIYEFLKEYLSAGLIRDRSLDNQARFLTLKKVQKQVAPRYIIYSDIVNYNLDIYTDFRDFENGFIIYDLPKIQALGRSYSQVGIAVKDLPNGKKYIVIILK